MSEHKRKKSIKEISPIDVYKLLPKTNCGECHEANCMTFATRVVNGELMIDDCPPITDKKNRAEYEKLADLMMPPVRTVTFGAGGNTVKVGGKYVLYRHEFTYHNPTPIAIDVADYMAKDEIAARLQMVSSFTFNYIGRSLNLDAIAIRSTIAGSSRLCFGCKGSRRPDGSSPYTLCVRSYDHGSRPCPCERQAPAAICGHAG